MASRTIAAGKAFRDVEGAIPYGANVVLIPVGFGLTSRTITAGKAFRDVEGAIPYGANVVLLLTASLVC